MNKHVALSIGAVSLAGLVLSANVIYASSTGGNGVPAQIAALQQQVATLKATVSNQSQQITTLQQGYTTLQNNQQGIQTTESLIEGEQRNIEGELKGMETTQSGIESTERGIESTEASIEAEQRGIEQQLGQFSQNLATLQNQVLGLTGSAGSGSGGSGSQGSPQTTGFTIQGTMTDGSGKVFFTPFHLVNGTSRYFPDNMNPSAGQFTFNNLPNGTYTVQFDMPEYQVSQAITVTVNGADVPNFQVNYPGPTYTVSGTATKSGNPLAYQNITVKDQSGTYGGYWGTTDANGNFTLSGIVPGTYTILIVGDPSNPLATTEASVDVTVASADVPNLKAGN